MEDTKDPSINITLFYSNPSLYADEQKKGLKVIYYNWLMSMAKKWRTLSYLSFTEMESFILARSSERIFYRKGRFLQRQSEKEMTLSKYHGNSNTSFNPVCGRRRFYQRCVKLPDGRIERRKGIIQDLMDIERVTPDKIDKEQYYLQLVKWCGETQFFFKTSPPATTSLEEMSSESLSLEEICPS